MKQITLEFKEIKILEFFAKETKVSMEISFNQYKTIKEVSIRDPAEDAYQMMSEIRRKVRAKNQNPESEDILSNMVHVTIKDDEHVHQKISFFLGKVSDKLHDLKNAKAAETYMSLMADLKNMKLNFY